MGGGLVPRRRSKPESRDDLALPRHTECRPQSVDVAETRRGLARRRVYRLRRLWIRGQRIVHLGSIENVRELDSDVETGPLMNGELPSDPEIFHWTALVPVVVIVSGGSELPGRRIRPCRRIQHECLARVETVAVEILSK